MFRLQVVYTLSGKLIMFVIDVTMSIMTTKNTLLFAIYVLHIAPLCTLCTYSVYIIRFNVTPNNNNNYVITKGYIVMSDQFWFK